MNTLDSLRESWRLAFPYWKSNEKWSARALLAAVIALNLGNVYVTVRINEWNNTFYGALQNFNSQLFLQQLGVFAMLAAAYIVMAVYALYLSQMLQIRWRRWLSNRFMGSWLNNRAYYQLQLSNGTDNPDQRIAEDLNQFCSYAITLSIGLLTSVVSLLSFVVILWNLSGPAALSLGKYTLNLPGYLVWAALLYAVVGTWLTFKVGRPLVGLNFAQQRLEADFRFGLVRLRENAESIASYRGEPAEIAILQNRFNHVFDNFWQIMKRQKYLTSLTAGYTQIAIIFPFLVVAPRYFAKQIALGGLMQVANAFSAVQTSLSFIVSSYTEIATWQAVVQRLSGFDKHLQAIQAREASAQRLTSPLIPGILAVKDLTVHRPDGAVLLEQISFDLSQGERMLIMGPTGAGKSTLLRTIAGLWPFCSGIIRIAEESTLFVPQRPYIPLGTLAEALLYPNTSERNDSKDRLAFVLMKVGLSDLVTELDYADQWFQRLSLGEQQRLAFARIFLAEPDIILLDEVTSALDEESELRLYQLLGEASWHPTIISVGHRTTLRKYHDRVLNVTAFQAGSGLETGKTGIAEMLGTIHGGLSRMAEPLN